MRQVKVQPLTYEAFAPYGRFYAMGQPKGYALCGELHKFYPDRLTADCDHRVGYSPIQVRKPERMIITQQEYHTTTWEILMPMDDDMIVHVAPASAGVPATEYAQAFIVPKFTMIKLNASVWHLAPLPVNNEQPTAMVILPECTYANDCTVVDLTPEQQFEIVL